MLPNAMRTALGTALLVIAGTAAKAQGQAAEHGIQLALQGRCEEALPLLKQARQEIQDKGLKKQAGKGGVRCSMILNRKVKLRAFWPGCSTSSPAIRRSC